MPWLTVNMSALVTPSPYTQPSIIFTNPPGGRFFITLYRGYFWSTFREDVLLLRLCAYEPLNTRLRLLP